MPATAFVPGANRCPAPPRHGVDTGRGRKHMNAIQAAKLAVVSISVLSGCGGGASKAIGPAGGTIESQGVRLTIPAGALQSPVDVSIVPAASASPGASEAIDIE